jgi:2-polyprenyl-3-methyl-5-hydroxy-6-metoxy-1,4-benzoquinol methylase
MKMVNTSERSTQREILDDFDLHGQELEKNFEDLDRVNNLLGGYRITLEGIEKILNSSCYTQPVSIIDVGCGNGSMLRKVAKFGKQKGIKMLLKGVDANVHAIEIAKKKSHHYPNISFEVRDVNSPGFQKERVDIILCTLTLHHFKNNEILHLVKTFIKVCQMGVVINDLHRSRLAYYLFMAFSRIFIKNIIARKDGLTSILRSFKKEDLQQYGSTLKVREQLISWKWAFRYQWIFLK